jgi:RNA polymerase sigma-70 factor (ECF subfamily)
MMSNAAPTPVEAETGRERALLSQAQGGEFGELCRFHEGRLLRQSMTLGCDISGAEDLVQETPVEAWKSLRRYNGSCRFYTWLCAILLNRHRNLFRQKRLLWFSQDCQPDKDLEQMCAPELSPDEAAEAREQARAIQNCIAALPARQQQVIHLRFYADDSLEGIAAVLGCSVGTVKSRLFHALEKLRRMKALRAPVEQQMTQTATRTKSAIALAIL